MKTIAAILMLTTAAIAGDTLQPLSGPPTSLGTSGTAPAFTLNPYPDLIITCMTGSVVVSTKTGHVEFRDGCELDDAAKSFWRAVEQMGIRRYGQ